MKIDVLHRLWILTLVPPAAWFVHLTLAYGLQPSACESKSKLLLFGATLLALLLLALNVAAARIEARQLQPLTAHGGAGDHDDDEPRPRGRTRFMVLGAIAASFFFALMVVGQTIPMLLLRACD